jgi:hypothetical protein
LPPAKATRTGETFDFVIRTTGCEAHNSHMGRILRRIKAWRRRQSEPRTDADKTDDWMTVGKTFRATDAAVHYNLPMSPKDEGRPPH